MTTIGADGDTLTVTREGKEGVVDKGHVHLDFDLPFYRKVTKGAVHIPVRSAGVGTAWTNAKAPLDFNPQNSLEFFLYLLQSDTFGFGHHTVSWGGGVTFRNFAMTSGDAMIKTEDGGISVGQFPVGTVPKVSKLRIFSLSTPMLYSYAFNRNFGFTLGPVVNFNLSSSIVNKYRLDGKNQKDKYWNTRCNLVTADLMFQLNFTHISVYAKYSPMNLLDKGYWPEFQSLSVGLALF